jgi:hypothetical protein
MEGKLKSWWFHFCHTMECKRKWLSNVYQLKLLSTRGINGFSCMQIKSQEMVTYKNPSEIACWKESRDAALSAPFSFRQIQFFAQKMYIRICIIYEILGRITKSNGMQKGGGVSLSRLNDPNIWACLRDVEDRRFSKLRRPDGNTVKTAICTWKRANSCTKLQI